MNVRVIQLAFESSRVGCLRLIEAVQIDIVEPKDKVRNGAIRTQTDCLPALFNRVLILSKGRVDWSRQESSWHRIARISLYPKLAGLFGLEQIFCSHDTVRGQDKILFGLAGWAAKFVGLSGVVCSGDVFLKVPIR